MRRKTEDAQIRRMKAFLIGMFILALAYDVWVVTSGNINLSRHVPGFPEIIAALWYYAFCRLEKIPSQLRPRS